MELTQEEKSIGLLPSVKSKECERCGSHQIDTIFRTKMVDDLDCEFIEYFVNHLQCKCENCKRVWYTKT